MARSLTVLVAALAFALVAALAVNASDSDVLVLTHENFDSTIAANDLILVEFYAPWCGHCKNLAPKYESAATQLKNVAPLAKVDCTAENALCGRFEVRGYPTVKVFRSGTPAEYPGPREADAIVAFMRKQRAPAVAEVTAENLATFVESDKVVVVFFGSKDSTEFEAFHTAAKELHNDFTFAHVDDVAASSTHGASAPGVVLFKKFDERKNVFADTIATDAIISFVKTNAVPIMDSIGPENYATYADSGLPLAYLFVSNDEQRVELGPVVEPLAKEFKGKINFVYIDANKYGGHAANLNLKQEWPAFAIQRPQQNLKYPLDQSQAINAENIRKFVSDFLSGAVHPSLKSEEIPASQDGPVTIVVGKQYSEIVNQAKDVLIEFYAPWCGHCKKLAPVYDELGNRLKENHDIVIAKMDATANDLPADAPFQVSGFPTIKLVKADNTIVDYNGDRTLEDLLKFLQENATHGSSLITGTEASKNDHDGHSHYHNEL